MGQDLDRPAGASTLPRRAQLLVVALLSLAGLAIGRRRRTRASATTRAPPTTRSAPGTRSAPTTRPAAPTHREGERNHPRQPPAPAPTARPAPAPAAVSPADPRPAPPRRATGGRDRPEPDTDPEIDGRLGDRGSHDWELEPTTDRQSLVWLSLPSAEALGFNRSGALALPGGGTLALPGAVPLPRPVPARESVPTRERAPRVRPAGRTRVEALSVSQGLTWPLTIVAVAGLALVLRLIGHSTNYDIFIDEITYSNIGQAVALGHGVTLYGPPFFLHPPLFFYLEAVVLDLFGNTHASPVNLVLELRPVNCVIGTLECGLLMILVSRIANRTAAVAVGVFVACDPFLLLWDGRVLLETLAMTTAVAGWLCLECIARRDVAKPAREVGRIAEAPLTEREWAVILLGGLLFGMSALAKETYGFVGVVPLFAMLVLGSPVSRRVSGAMFAVPVGCYAVYLVTVVINGDLSAWWNANLGGVLRAVGTKQITGFNQSGHHASLGGRLGADFGLYLISYLVIAAVALAALAGVVRWLLAVRARRTLSTQRRLAIVLGAGAVGYVGYAVVFGAFEVQIFYMCIIGGLPVLVTEVTGLGSRLSSRLGARAILVSCTVLATLAMTFELAADVRLRTEKDTGLSQLTNYVSAHVPDLSLVDSTDGVTQFILSGVRIDGPRTVAGLERDRPGYVVVDAGLVNEGYVGLGPGFQAWLNAHARVVFHAKGRSTGTVDLYRTIYAAAGQDTGG